MLHFPDDHYHETLCGIPIDEDNDPFWTDAFIETIEDTPDDMCPTCLKKGKRVMQQLENESRREIAMEEGMLQGIDAYNEIMGWD